MFRTQTSTFRALGFLVSAALMFFLFTPTSFAQEADRVAPVPVETAAQNQGSFLELPPLCPISGFVTGELSTDDGERISDEYFGRFTVSNPTDYHIAGVRAAIALYADADDIAPSFWAVLPGEHQLSPGVSNEVEFALDATGLSVGSYVVRPIVMQGGVHELLGAAVRNSELPGETTIIKEGNRSSEYSVSVAVNGQTAGLQTLDLTGARNLTASVVTTNETDGPLLNSEMTVVISQGDVPLGAAVRESVTDSVKLVPGGSRTTTIVDSNLQGGSYTVHAALTSEGILQPVERAVLRVGEEVPNATWPYISRIGSTDFPLQPDTQIAACVNYLGSNAEAALISEPLGVEFAVLDGNGQQLATAAVDNLSTAVSDWYAFTPGISADDFSLQVNLMAEKYLSIVPLEADEEITLAQRNEVSLDSVQTVTGVFSCDGVEECDASAGHTGVTQTSGGEQSGSNSFWFYGAIIIAAALLMYIMLRRLHPEHSNEIIDEKNELQ